MLSSDPEQGAPISEGAEVNLIIASGQNAVPNLVDLPIRRPTPRPRSAPPALTVGEVDRGGERRRRAGHRARQDPAGAVVVDLGTPVNLVVAIAPAVRPRRCPTSARRASRSTEAEDELNDAGFTNVTISDDSDQPCQNNPSDNCIVVSQNPAAGTEVEDPANEEVTLMLE